MTTWEDQISFVVTQMVAMEDSGFDSDPKSQQTTMEDSDIKIVNVGITEIAFFLWSSQQTGVQVFKKLPWLDLLTVDHHVDRLTTRDHHTGHQVTSPKWLRRPASYDIAQPKPPWG